MYKLCLALGILSCATAYATGGMEVPVMTVDQESAHASEHETRQLLRTIEGIRQTNDVVDCKSLQPIPLYQGSPSLHDWTAFCLARVRRDESACDSLPAMLVPDVRTLCHGA